MEEEDQKVLMDRVLRQRADNERNIWKRRTVKRVGLPIVRFEDLNEEKSLKKAAKRGDVCRGCCWVRERIVDWFDSTERRPACL